jgi:RNA polymerase sigma factor (sigma-70 family)
MYDFGEALVRQCLARINHYLETHSPTITENKNNLATRIAALVEHNERRLPDLPSDPHTNVPGAYIDDVIRYYLQETPRIKALKAGDISSWETLLNLLKRRVYTNLRRYYVKTNDFDTLAAEIVQSCSFLIWMKLEQFRYDCPLDAWVSYFVANEVRDICRSAGFKNRQKNVSFDQPLHDRTFSNTDSFTLGDLLIDKQASQDFLMVDRLLTIKAGFIYLSPAQRELVRRQLEGQTTLDIAQGMGCSPNAVYKLRQRAVDKLRTFIELGQAI